MAEREPGARDDRAAAGTDEGEPDTPNGARALDRAQGRDDTLRRTNEPETAGQAASPGCIRLPNAGEGDPDGWAPVEPRAVVR